MNLSKEMECEKEVYDDSSEDPRSVACDDVAPRH